MKKISDNTVGRRNAICLRNSIRPDGDERGNIGCDISRPKL